MEQFAGGEASRWGPDHTYEVYADMETYSGPPNTFTRGYTGPFNIFQNGGNNELATQILESGRDASLSSLDHALPISEPGDDTDFNNKQDISLPRQFQYYLNPDFTREHSGIAFLGPDVLDPVTLEGVNGRHLKEEVDAVVDRVIFHKSRHGQPRR